MPRKRIPTSTNSPAAATALLDDDEQLVEETTTTKRIGRQRRTPTAEVEVTPPPADFIDIDDDGDEIEQPIFAETSIAAMLFRDQDESSVEDQFCTIAVRRNPDSMNDRFAVPCATLTNMPPLRNVGITEDKMDIEDRVRSFHNGGNYFFQIHYNNRLGGSWKATLSDLPGWKPPTAEPTHEPTPVVQTAPAANPMDTFLADLERTKRLKEALFGDDQKRYEDSIAALRSELDAAKTATSNEPPMSEELLMWKMAKDMPESEAKNRLLDKLMPADESGNRHWIVDAAQLALENKDAIIGVVGSIFGAFVQPQQPAQPPNIADMMRSPAPALPTRPSVFTKKPEPTPAEPPPPPEPIAEPVTEAADISKGDETAIEAEVVTEEPKKNERRKRTAA